MRAVPTEARARSAVVDLGSNSVRLVVFEERSRNPLPILNERLTLRLGRGVATEGRLDPAAMAQVVMLMERFRAIAKAMRAAPFEVLATAAVREAENGPDLIAKLKSRAPDVPIRIISGEEEAELSATGVLASIPDADGILGDIGGGSLELAQLSRGTLGEVATLRLGVIRLAERAERATARAEAIAAADIGDIGWLGKGAGRDLYLSGGTFRAFARVHIAETRYPLAMVHRYTLARDEAREFARILSRAPRRALERLPGLPRRRIEDLPFAAVVLRRLLRVTGARRVVFSASGLREGWFLRHIAPALRADDPMLAAAKEWGEREARDPPLLVALIAWTAPAFVDESAITKRLRECACWLSDIGCHDHPEYRAEQTFFRVLRQPGLALDHQARAFLALVLALRYEADRTAAFLAPVRALLDITAARRAEAVGAALRLAYALSAGVPELLAASRLAREDTRVVLRLVEGEGVYAGEGVQRRLERLAEALACDCAIETMTPEERTTLHGPGEAQPLHRLE